MVKTCDIGMRTSRSRWGRVWCPTRASIPHPPATHHSMDSPVKRSNNLVASSAVVSIFGRGSDMAATMISTALVEKSRRRREGLELPELPELLAMTNRFDTKGRNEDETHHCTNDGAVRLS